MCKTEEIVNLVDESDERIADALEQGIKKAISRHISQGVSVAIWDYTRNGIEILPPDRILARDSTASTADAASGK